MWKQLFLAVILALSGASVGRAAVTVNVGGYYLPPGAVTQIQIPVTSSTGSDQVPGCDFAVQVGDGTTGPAITNIGLTSGTIFFVPGAVQFTPSGNTAQVWFTNVALAGGGNPSSVTVPVSGGMLANMTINTSGFSSGTFPLSLSGVLAASNPPSGYSTDFTSAGPIPAINNGSITVVPVPTVAYWNGSVDGNWSTGSYSTGVTNWRTDAAGAADTHVAPGAVSDVFFVTNGGGANLNTALDADFSIKGLTFNSAATNPVAVGGSHTLTLGADGLTMRSGAAAATIGSSVALGTSQTWTTSESNPLTVTGVLSLGGFTLTKAGTGTVRISAAPTLSSESALVVSAGMLRFNVASGAATIGTGVNATVASGATLELAGSVSALANGSNRVNITNNSSAAAGILVSGTNQVVGNIDGSGNTVVNAGSDLTANHIIQSALVIGGTAGSHGLVMIAASDASGNPLGQPSGFALAGSPATSDSFGADGIGSAGLSSDGGLDRAAFSTGDSPADGNPSSVPEPSTFLLMLLAVSSVVGLSIARRRRVLRNGP